MSDPDFEAFFAGEFQRLLRDTSIPGMTEPSWGRRAAWLLWCERKRVPDTAFPPNPEIYVSKRVLGGGLFD